jgi:hypothetical protein
MKKRNLVLHTAIAGALVSMFGAASAGTLTAANTVFATEIFGPSFAAATGITPGAISTTISTTNGIVINAGGKIYHSARLTNGLFVNVAGVGALTGTALAVGGVGNGVVGAAVLSTDRTTATFPITYTNAATLGVGSTLVITPGALGVNGVNTSMATAGATITAVTSLSAVAPVITAPSLTTTPNTGTALAGDIDNGVTASANVATSTSAVVFAVTPSSSFPLGYSLGAGTGAGQAGLLETAKIDLTATSPGSRFTQPGATLSNANSATVLNLGAVIMGNTAAAQNKADGATPYLINGSVTVDTLGGTVVGAFKATSTMNMTTDAACTTAVATAPNGVFTSGTTFTFTGTTVPGIAAIEGASAPSFICLTTPSTTGSITVSAPTATFSVTAANHVLNTDSGNTATGTLYSMTQNGSTRDVRSYIPVAVSGYTSFVRVINTGGVAATVTGQWLYEDGTTSTAATLITPALAVNGSTTLTSTQVEAALGAPTATIGSNRPRLRLTANTNGLQAQSFFLTNANGNFSDVTGAQD